MREGYQPTGPVGKIRPPKGGTGETRKSPFDDWKEKRVHCSKEGLYQEFKDRFLSEVVAKEKITYMGEEVGEKVYELGEKDK
jgi:hypothetical protein